MQKERQRKVKGDIYIFLMMRGLIFHINRFYLKQQTINLLMRNRTQKASYILVIAIVSTFLLRTSSTTPNYGMMPVNKYINVTTVSVDTFNGFQNSGQISYSYFKYTFPYPRTNRNYQAEAIPQISLQFKDQRKLVFQTYMYAISQTAVQIYMHAYNLKKYFLLSFNILIFQLEFMGYTNIMVYRDTLYLGNIAPGFKKTSQDNFYKYPVSMKVLSSLTRYDISVGESLEVGLNYSSWISPNGYFTSSIISTASVEFTANQLMYKNILVDTQILSSLSPAGRITYGTFGDTTGTNANLKVLDTSNIIRDYNTLIGLRSFKTKDGKLSFNWKAKNSESIQANPENAWDILQFSYMIFEFENCYNDFVFKDKTKECVCPLPNSVVIEGKCFPCTNISLYSNRTAFNTSTCNCNETFIFNSTTKTCVCPQENSVIIEGKCFSCLQIINSFSTGLVNSSQPDSCECNSTYVFNKTAKACQCPSNSIILDNKCFLCTDLKDKNSSGLVNFTSDSPACQCFPTFVFKTTSKSCECPDINSYISLGGKCVSCSGVGPVDQTNRSCICEPNYTYNHTTNKCVCLVSKLFALSTCFSCSSIRYRNSTGLVDPKDSSLCECYHSFVFYTQTNICQCPDPLSYVSITSVCVSCRDIGNNTNEVNGTTCVCSQSYVYNAKLNKCLCPPSSIIINSLCFSCYTLTGKNSSGLVSPTNPKQCQCTVTFTFNSETKQCGCPNDVNYFVSQQNRCVSCLNIENGNGEALASSKACQCNETYVYSAIQNKCICPARSIVLQNGQCFSCQTLKSENSSGLVNTVTKNTCQCSKTFYFNIINKACECPQGQFVSKRGKCLSCAGAEGTGEFNQTSKECICNETYIYSSSLNKCVCPPTSAVINSQCFVCSTLKGKNGTGEISKTSSSVCQCLKSFVFTEEKTCECPNAANSFVSKGGLCVSCLGIANGLNDEADLTSKKCVCKQSFVYHQGTNQCRCPLSSVIIGGFCFQCSTLKNKNSTGVVSNTDPSSCSCLTSFLFDPASKTCLCPNEANSFVSSAGRCVSCIGIQNGQNDEANITSRTCVCKSSFVYVGSANKCECPQSSIIINGKCFSCSTLMNKNSTGGVNATTGNTCRCLRSYVFNPDAKVCQCPDDAHSYISPTKQCVSCSEVQNGTGAATKNGCECKDSSFVYNPSLNKCLCPPTHVFSGGSCILTSKSQTNKEVTCPENLKWDIFLQKCVCKPGFVLKGNLCIDCTSIANAKGDASDKISCICVEGYAWDSTEYLCK